MASNYPAGAENDPNAPYNQVDYPPRPHEVELSVTFRLNTEDMEDAEEEADWIASAIDTMVRKMGVDVDDIVVEVEGIEAGYDEDYNIYGDYFDDYDSHGDYYFHDED